jgi:hypothetical protein
VQRQRTEIDEARVRRGDIAEHEQILPAGVGWRRIR